MAGFCSGCGFPLGANATFCSRCGGRQATANAQPMSAPAQGSGLKILVVVLVCLGVAGATVVGSIWYVAHRVKAAVVEKAQANGVDLNVIPPPKTSFNRKKTHKACDLLSKEEASQMLGEPVERTTTQDAACLYFGPPGLSAKLAQDLASATIKKVQAPNSNVGGMEVANAVDQVMGSLGAAAGQTGVGGELPLLMLAVDDDGRPHMAAINISNALFTGIVNADQESNKDAEKKKGPGFGLVIKGLGDQAVRLPKLGLNVLQGDTLVNLIPGPVPDSDAKTVDIARMILKRL